MKVRPPLLSLETSRLKKTPSKSVQAVARNLGDKNYVPVDSTIPLRPFRVGVLKRARGRAPKIIYKVKFFQKKGTDFTWYSVLAGNIIEKFYLLINEF